MNTLHRVLAVAAAVADSFRTVWNWLRQCLPIYRNLPADGTVADAVNAAAAAAAAADS